MATYKQPCMHCGSLVDRDARFCPTCGSSTPFGYHCPNCLRSVEKGQKVCSGCGRLLYITCPYCKEQTFVQDVCERCEKNLTVKCDNKLCGSMQFFMNEKCTVCGKKIKIKDKQLREVMKNA